MHENLGAAGWLGSSWQQLAGAFPGDNRGEAPTTCSLRLLNGLAFDFRLQGVPQPAEGGADDIKVEVTDEMLTIQGERKHEKEEKREGYYYGERAYGSFYRAIPLPEGADPAKATAEFHNGVLEVTMPAPKRPEKKSRLLEIQENK